ncbi:MAG: PAS domain S-box protein [Chitinophagaceae bacterium]|nr:MAG: PAS domain S-box protein [Chitinophagaceae bacterium]
MSDLTKSQPWKAYEAMPVQCLVLLPGSLIIAGASDQYLDFFKLDREAIIGKPICEILEADDELRQRFHASIDEALNSGNKHELAGITYRIKTAEGGGEKQLLTLTHIPVATTVDRPAHILHFAERARISSAEKKNATAAFESLFKNITDYSIFFMTLDGTITSWNEGAAIIHRYTAAEAIGQSFNLFYPPEEVAQGLPEASLKKAAATGSFETRGWQLRKGNEKFYGHIIFTAVKNAIGETKGFFKVTRDITREVENKAQIRFLADITSNINDPIITTDLQLSITRWNEAAEKMFQWTAAEALGNNTLEVLRAQISSEERLEILESVGLNGIWQGEVTYLNKTGKSLEALCTVSYLKGNDGTVNGYLILIKDITRRKTAERELAELNARLEQRVQEGILEAKANEAKYRQLFEDNPVPMWVIAMEDFKFLAVNDMAVQQYGYSREEFLAMTALDIRPLEQRKDFIESDHSFRNQPLNVYKGTWQHVRKDGSLIHVQIVSHDITFENVPAKMVFANDITDQVEAEEKLAAREVFFRSIIENSAEGISLVNEKYETIYRSNAALKMAGKLNTDSALDKIHPDDQAMLATKRVEMLENPGLPIPFLARFKFTDQDYLWLEGTFTNLFHVEGVKAIVTNFRDVTERILAEERLAASEKQFRNTLNNMLEGAQILGFDWRYKYVNKTLVESSKYSKEELLGFRIMDRYPGIEATPVFEAMRGVMETRIAMQMENEFVFPDGSIAHFQLSIQPVPEGIFVLSIDITERKLAEAEIQKSQNNTRAILERISDAFVAIDNDWKYEYVNSAAGLIMNRSPEEMIGKHSINEFVEVKDHKLYAAMIAAKETQEHRSVEEYYSPLDIWIAADIYPSPAGLSIFLADISQRKKAEIELRESQENLQAIFENASEGFILMDREGIIKVFNHNIVNSILLGVSDDIRIGETIFNVVQPDRVPFFRQVLSDVLKGDTIQYDRRFMKKNGHATWINLVINPVYQDGKVEGICITGRDITEKKNAEEQLQKTFSENLAMSDRLSSIINTLPANIALLDKNGDIMEVNKAWQQFNNVGRIGKDFSIGKNYVEVARAGGVGANDDSITMARGVSAVLQGQLDEFVYEYSIQVDAKEVWYRKVVTPLKNAGHNDGGAVIMHMDISELRRLEAERLRQQKVQQQTITKAILRGQEKERNHIGRELHDNINQILAGTRMYLSIAGSKDEVIKKSIQYPLELLDESIKEIRVLCSNMVTPLQDVNLEDMIRDLLIKLSKFQLKFEFEYNVPNDPLSDELKLNLYRIIQELSQNITKYAEARMVRVVIWTDDTYLNMIVTDDGKGFDVNARRNGIGLLNMQNRAKSFNGKIQIESKPGEGTKTTLAIPYKDIPAPILN